MLLNVPSVYNNECSITNKKNSPFCDLAPLLNMKIEIEFEGRAMLDAFGPCLLGCGICQKNFLSLCEHEFVCECMPCARVCVSARVYGYMLTCRTPLYLMSHHKFNNP